MAAVLLIVRPSALLLQALITNQAIAPGLTNLIRWQSHWHVVRQSWTFFQNDFAGRIANRIMQTGPALRESVVAGTNAVWYILVYGGSAILLLARNDLRLAIPVMLLVLRLRRLPALFRAALARPLARDVGGALGADRPRRRQLHQHPDGQAVRPAARRGRVRARMRWTSTPVTFQRQLRLITLFSLTLTCLNALMVVGTGAMAVWLWNSGAYRRRHRRHGAAAHLADRQHRRAGWRRTSPRSSRMSAWCRTACAPSPCRARCATGPTPAN